MLIFVDESEWPRPKDPSGFTVWGAIAIHPSKSREFFRREFCEELLSLCKLNGVTAFAAGLKNLDQATFSQEMTEPVVYRAYSRILERVNAMMVEDHHDDMAIVALDSQDEKTDTARARAFGNFLYGSPLGHRLTHIVETPFFVSSKATLGIQLADLVAYALAQQNQGRTDIKDICDRVRELEWQSNSVDEDSPRRGFRFEDLKTRGPDMPGPLR